MGIPEFGKVQTGQENSLTHKPLCQGLKWCGFVLLSKNI